MRERPNDRPNKRPSELGQRVGCSPFFLSFVHGRGIGQEQGASADPMKRGRCSMESHIIQRVIPVNEHKEDEARFGIFVGTVRAMVVLK